MALDETKSAAELAAEVKTSFDKKFDAVQEIAQKALAEAENGKKMAQADKEKADEALMEMNGFKAQLDQLEQKLARGGSAETSRKSVGELFTDSDSFKEFAANPRKGASADLEVKADITTGTGAGGMSDAIHSSHIPGIMPLPQRRMTVRDLITAGRTDGPIIDYDKETGFTNNAAPVAEGALKPQSDISIEEVQTRTKVLAHWMRISKQALSDVSQIRSVIDQRLLYGLAYVEEQQMLYGDGTGENLHGIVPQATAYSAPITVAGETSLDKVRLMILQAAVAQYPATGIVMNDLDLAFIETMKDANGLYIIGNPQGTMSKTLWGLPVVTTQAMTVDKVLVGAFKMGAQVFDQWSSRIETGFQNDDFTRNKVTILAEERLALAVYRPEAFIYGDFGRVA